MKIITCTGFGNSGSSAATDFFSEFNNIKVVPHDFEFTLIHESDGLYDLEKAVREGHRLKVDLAVKRFISLTNRLEPEYKKYLGDSFLFFTKEFISNAIGCKWDGWWHRINDVNPLTFKQRVVARQLEYRFHKDYLYSLYENDGWEPNYLPPTTEYYESDIDKFLYNARIYLYNLFNCLNKNDKEYLLIDQLLPPTSIDLYIHYFEEIYVIIIDRDPRDYYFANNMFWASRYIPSENLNTYISWYEATRKLVVESNKVKKVLLEDLVYNYDFITDELIRFCKLRNENWLLKGKIFIPEKSKINTGLFFKYHGYENEIETISIRLSKYLFDYKSVVQTICDKKDSYPVMNLIKQYDNEYKEQKISPLGIILSVKHFLKSL